MSAAVSTTQTKNRQWVSEKEAAVMLGVSLSKLRSDRHKHKGIPYTKFGKAVRYELADLFEFMSEAKIFPTQTVLG